MNRSRLTADDFDDADFFDGEFDVETFIETMEGRGRRRRRRSGRSGRRHVERRLEDMMLQDELADWDDYDPLA